MTPKIRPEPNKPWWFLLARISGPLVIWLERRLGERYRNSSLYQN